jgi:hypothetical protein
MALVAQATPQVLTPAYNPVKYIYSSSNVNLQGFKFIYDIYQSGTLNKIAEYRVLPTYGTGFGEIDLSKLLQAQVSYDLNLNNTSVYNAPGSHYKYDVRIGEEYITTTTYALALTQYITAPYAGRVQINVANTFLVGDQINITQNLPGPTANPNLEGLFTVLVANPLYIVVNSLWSLVTNAGTGGAITYADGRKTVNRNLAQVLNRYVFNGAIRWSEWPSYNYQDYMLNGFTDDFLTNYPAANKNMYATLSQDMWFNAVANNSPTAPDTMVFENDGGNIFEKNVTAVDHVSGISVGPNNFGALTLVFGSGNLIEPTTDFYEFHYERNGVVSSARYMIRLDRRIRTTEYSILFLDRLGSWGSFAFTLNSYEKGNVTREQFNQDVAGYINGVNQWDYELTDRGMTNTYVSTETTIDLATNFMTMDMANYFTELISSPFTYVKKSSYANDCDVPESEEYISCNIMTSDYQIYNQRNKNLIKQNVTIKLANNNIVNG